MLIEIKSRYTKEVIFSLDKEKNSVKETLEEAVRQGVDLTGVYFIGEDLHGANLAGGHFRTALFTMTNLTGADLGDADLRGSSFAGTNLDGVNFENADIRLADFSTAKNVPDLPMACPKEGSFIGWKKVLWRGEIFLIKLEIPDDAKRSSATTNKCRCSKAKVLEIVSLDTCKNRNIVVNYNMFPCQYEVGEYVYPDSFNENRWEECSHGIHFFMTAKEAVKYMI